MTVGEMPTAQERHPGGRHIAFHDGSTPSREAHDVFVNDDRYIASASVFEITDLLMANFVRHEAWRSAGRTLDVSFFTQAYDSVMRQTA